MLPVDLNSLTSRSRTPCILFLGAHCDDIEIGCGGTVLNLASRYPAARFVWVTLSSDDVRAQESNRAAAELLAGADNVHIRMMRFRGSYFPYEGAAVKDCFEELARTCDPDVVFTHFRHDRHQDHRTVSDLTWNTFRDHLILEYEIPKYDGDVGQPNVFVPLAREILERKIDILLRCFPSQRSRNWFTPETFSAMARLRGIECNAPDGFAEAFHTRKLTLTP